MKPVEEVQHWVRRVVVGLGLCPFARQPLENDKIRFVESRADDESTLLAEMMHEFELLTIKTKQGAIDTYIHYKGELNSTKGGSRYGYSVNRTLRYSL